MYVTVEGDLDAAVMRRLLSDLRLPITRLDAEGGRSKIKTRVPKLLEAAQRVRWLVVVDLDDDDCPPTLMKQWNIPTDAHLIFRVVTRAVESWIMGDRSGLAKFLNVSEDRVPVEPETLDDPKGSLIAVAKHSRNRDIRDGLVPRESSGRKQGPLYTVLLSEFVRTDWNPRAARVASSTLDRCLTRLEKLK